jgi:hypothetical protein
VLRGAGIDHQDVAGAAVFQTGEHGHQVIGRGDGNSSSDHTDAARVRAELAWQDAQRLVRVGRLAASSCHACGGIVRGRRGSPPSRSVI